MKNVGQHQTVFFVRTTQWAVSVCCAFLACLPAFCEPVDFEVIEKHSGADFAQGYQLQQQGKPEEALQAFTKSIAAHPENTETYMRRAEVLIGLKKYREAQADLSKFKDMIQQTADKDNKSKLASLALQEAEVSDGMGYSADALNKFKLALKYDDTVLGHKALGSYYLRHGDRELAIQELQQVKKSMNSGWGYNNWGKAETEVDDMLKELNAAPTRGGQSRSKTPKSNPQKVQSTKVTSKKAK